MSSALPFPSLPSLNFNSNTKSNPNPNSLSFTYSTSQTLTINQTPSITLTLFHNHSPPPVISLTVTPSRNGRFLGPDGPGKLDILKNYSHTQELEHGILKIRPMEDEELDSTVDLLAGSFAESIGLPAQYVHLLAILVKQYVVERRVLMPHMTVLVGFYKDNDGDSEWQLACAAEISFDAVGANATPPTPAPPLECPYICNMTVKKELRRKQIGTYLLRACEELIKKMKTERRVYLHCRVIDKIPFNMYKKASYKVAKTDSILVWLSLQRRKYLMCKELEPASDQSDTTNSDDPTT